MEERRSFRRLQSSPNAPPTAFRRRQYLPRELAQPQTSVQSPSLQHQNISPREQRLENVQEQIGGSTKALQEACAVCDKLKKGQITSHLYLCPVTDLSPSSLQPFYTIINALLNSGGGVICLHLPRHISPQLFSRSVDDRLSSLVADSSLYTDNYECLCRDDGHVVYRVKTTPASNLSTLHFPSSVFINNRLAHPTQLQIKRLMRSCPKSLPSDFVILDLALTSPTFTYLESVTGQSHGVCPENLHCADMALIQRKQGRDFGEKVLNYWWEDLNLPKFISAVCKLRDGGSLYLGFDAESFEVQEQSWFPFEELQIKVINKKDTTLPASFICKGVPINLSQQQSFSASLDQRIRSDLLWHPSYFPQKVVRAVFRKVEGGGGEDLFVIDVKVKPFPGVVFYERDGPQAFTAAHLRDSSTVERIAFDNYAKFFWRKVSATKD